MALDRSDGSKWKPFNEVGKLTTKNKTTVDMNFVTTCKGTLRGVFGMHNGKEKAHYYPGTKACICHNHTHASKMDINTRVPLLMIIPSTSWNITLTLIINVELLLASIKNWSNQGHCGTNRQYLKDLSTNPKLKKVYLQAKAFINPFVKHIVTQHYKCLTYYKVGAIRSRGEKSQLELTGSLHCDYQDDVNK